MTVMDAAKLKAAIEGCHLTPSSLAKLMIECGDSGDYPAVARRIHRQLTGASKVSGEMAAFMGLLRVVMDVTEQTDRILGRFRSPKDPGEFPAKRRKQPKKHLRSPAKAPFPR